MKHLLPLLLITAVWLRTKGAHHSRLQRPIEPAGQPSAQELVSAIQDVKLIGKGKGLSQANAEPALNGNKNYHLNSGSRFASKSVTLKKYNNQ